MVVGTGAVFLERRARESKWFGLFSLFNTYILDGFIELCDQILFFVIHVLIVMVSQNSNMFKTLCAKYLYQCLTLFYLDSENKVIYHELGETGERNVNTEARPSIVALIQAQSRREGGRRDRGTNRPLVTVPPR